MLDVADAAVLTIEIEIRPTAVLAERDLGGDATGPAR
jgi:hypothetical protein